MLLYGAGMASERDRERSVCRRSGFFYECVDAATGENHVLYLFYPACINKSSRRNTVQQKGRGIRRRGPGA